MIESELCLLQVQEELLLADTLEPGESVFGVAPEGLDSVDVVILDGEFVVCVTDSEVLSESDINQPVVANPTIAMNHRIQGDLSANQPLQGSFLGVWHNLSPHLIAAFQDAKDDGLVASSTSTFSLDPVRAEIRFVDFDDSAERGLAVGDGSEASAQPDENVVHRTNRHTGHPRRRTGRKVLSEASVMVPGTELPICYSQLNVDIEVLAGKGRAPNTVKMRELIGMVGVERFGVKVTELADVLGKSRDGVSCWMRRGVERRATDPSFAAAAERLEYVASEEP